MKYTKQDELLIKELLEKLYEHHEKMHGGGLSGGKFSFNDFVHGFTLPFKQFGSLFDVVAPGSGLGDIVKSVANTVDGAVPGKRYDSISDALKGKGKGKKIKVEVQLMPAMKRPRGRPKKA